MIINSFISKVFGKFEELLFGKWFNPIYTLYFNLRQFPISQAFIFPVAVYGFPKLRNLSGRCEVKGDIKPCMITLNKSQIGNPSNTSLNTEFINKGLIIFNGCGEIGTGNKINIFGVLTIGDNFKISDFVNLSCFSKITIGKYSRIAHGCQIMDSNFHYVLNIATNKVKKHTKPISIGRNCWICNRTTITGGTVLNDFTIVASNSLVGNDYSEIPENSIIGGSPAKLLSTGIRRIENNELNFQIDGFFLKNSDKTDLLLNEIPQVYWER